MIKHLLNRKSVIGTGLFLLLILFISGCRDKNSSSFQLPITDGTWSLEKRGDDDLEVRYDEINTSIYIPRSSLLSLKVEKAELEIETAAGKRSVEGVLLETLVERLPYLDWNVVLANCGDGYQSNYGEIVLRNNRPLLIHTIEGQTVADWTMSIGHPEWGPYMILLLDYGTLPDPTHKNPWGVQNLVIGKEEEITEFMVLTMSPLEKAGWELFKGNCMSCHNIPNTSFGGSVSTRKLDLLSALAKFNESYVRQMLKDPVGTNPLAAKMPAVPHYSEEQINSLLSFLRSYKVEEE